MSGALAKAHAHGGQRNLPSLAVRLGLDSGIHRLLETPLSINGAEGSTILRFPGSQASAAGWPEYGGAGTLALQAGTAPTYGVAVPWLADGALEGAVRGNAGAVFAAASGALGDVATEDTALRIVWVPRASSGTCLAGKIGAANKGWFLWDAGTLQFSIRFRDGTSLVTVGPVGVTLNALNLFDIFVDKSGSAAIYRNGALGEQGVISSLGSFSDATTALQLLGNAAIATCNADILYAALHIRDGWLDTHLQATASAEGWALLTASRPSFSTVPSTYPTAAGSTSPVYQQRRLSSGADQLFYMGAGTPTFDRIVDANGRAHVGHLVEIAAQNVIVQNCTLATTWTTFRATVPTTAVVCPDGVTRTTSTIHEDATAGNSHGIYAALTTTSARWTASAYVKAANRSWIQIAFGAICSRYFDVANGALGAGAGTASNKTASIEALGGGWFRCSMSWDGGVATDSLYLTVGEADADNSFDGLNQDSLYAFAAQATASDRQSSPIITTTAAVTRAASSLKYSIANCLPRSEGSLVGALLCRSFTPDRARVFASLDDGSANNRIELFTTATTGLLSALSRKAAGTDGDVVHTALGTCFDNKVRPFLLTWNAAELALWVKDPTTHQWSVVRDTSFTVIPGTTLTLACIGHDNAIANHVGPGAWPLVDWAVCPQHFDHPSQVRRADSISWEGI